LLASTGYAALRRAPLRSLLQFLLQLHDVRCPGRGRINRVNRQFVAE
jgi:hypothetical protein